MLHVELKSINYTTVHCVQKLFKTLLQVLWALRWSLPYHNTRTWNNLHMRSALLYTMHDNNGFNKNIDLWLLMFSCSATMLLLYFSCNRVSNKTITCYSNVWAFLLTFSVLKCYSKVHKSIYCLWFSFSNIIYIYSQLILAPLCSTT